MFLITRMREQCVPGRPLNRAGLGTRLGVLAAVIAALLTAVLFVFVAYSLPGDSAPSIRAHKYHIQREPREHKTSLQSIKINFPQFL